jgi:thymidylate synthase
VAILTSPQFEGLRDAYVAVVGQIADHYEYANAPRGNASRECLHMGFTLANPVSRAPFLAARKINIVFHFAEALWYLWGRNDLEMMAYYAPRMRSYSMDGKTLRGSAYGSRLFHSPPGGGQSTFAQILGLIREDAATKRAVMTMFRPEELAVPGNLDVACVLAFQLFLRGGRLHAICYMRANDADQGLLSDVFSFTLLQEFAARQLGVPVGTYTHYAGSMHIADSNLPRIRQVLSEARNGNRTGPLFEFPAMPDDASWVDLDAVQVHEELLRTNQRRHTPGTIAETGLRPYWQQILLLFEAHRQIKHTEDPVGGGILTALDPGFRWLLHHRWPDRVPAGAVTEGSTVR